MKKAVIYARYSCDRQTEQSIEGQMRVCNEFAQQNQYEIICCYIDRAATGLNDNREGFQKMIKDSADKEFQFVIVYKLDRFSRNRYDSAINKGALKKNGVKVLSASEQITDTPEGVILEALLEGFAEYYSAELSQKVKRGIIETRNKGLYTGGHVNFGYKIIDRKWVIDDKEARIVRKIFNYYSEGMSMKEICGKINKSKPVIDLRHVFTAGALARMLNNKRYIGVVEGDKVYNNIIPAIVNKEVFKKVREELDKRRHRSAHFKAKERYLLSGKLFCGSCGALMTSETGTGKSKRVFRYYKCVNRKLHRTCTAEAPSKALLEKLVITHMLNLINDEQTVNRIESYYMEAKKECKKDLYPKLNREKKQLKKKMQLFINADMSNESHMYQMINTFVEKIVFLNETLYLDTNIIETEMKIVLEK